MTTVFLMSPLHPCSRIREVQAEIVKHVQAWAIYKGRRYLLGSTAFFTEAAARRCKLAALVKRAKIEFLRFRYPHMMYAVQEQLKNPQHAAWTVRR